MEKEPYQTPEHVVEPALPKNPWPFRLLLITLITAGATVAIYLFRRVEPQQDLSQIIPYIERRAPPPGVDK